MSYVYLVVIDEYIYRCGHVFNAPLFVHMLSSMSQCDSSLRPKLGIALDVYMSHVEIIKAASTHCKPKRR